MADKKATLILELKDKASRGLGKLTGALKKLRAGWLGVAAAVTGAVVVGAKAVKAYAKQEDAVNKLNQALKNQGEFSQETSEDLQRYAASLQKVTTVGDETILEQQALLASFGATGDELKKATEASLDLASGLGIDLKAASLLVGKALAGDTATLSRYGIKIAEGTEESKKFEAVLEQINARFGGQAQAQLNTFSGRVENLKNRFGDLAERIGRMLIPFLEKVVSLTSRIVGWIEKWAGESLIASDQFLSDTQKRINALEEEREALFERYEEKRILDEEDRQRIVEITEELKELKIKAMEEEAKAKAKLDKQKRKSEDIYTKGQMKAIDSRIKAAIKEAQMHKILYEQRKQDFQSTLQFISSLSQSENKKLASIGKAAAIATATIDTFAGVGKAWALGPILGPPLAALVLTAGMANVARISGVQLAEGGIVMPQQGGVQATIAEAGQPEAVIPLEDADSPVGPTINIQAGVLVGGEDSARALAQMVDKELFRLRRSRESVAFEGL